MATPRTKSAGQSGDGALATFMRSHRRLLDLCNTLEDFADALPNRLDSAACKRLGKSLVPLLRQCHRLEEQCVETIGRRLSEPPFSIERLRREHLADRYFAEEIADALDQVSDTTPLANPEALGFMLRSFFETQRKHIAFEKEYVVPALGAAGNATRKRLRP